MRFIDIVNLVSAYAFTKDMPLVFGDIFNQNVEANDIDRMFLTLDIPNQTYPGNTVLPVSAYTVVIRCMDESFYMRDKDREIDVLARTDLEINELVRKFACSFDLGSISVLKLQGEYDTIKSGWQVTMTVNDEAR